MTEDKRGSNDPKEAVEESNPEFEAFEALLKQVLKGGNAKPTAPAAASSKQNSLPQTPRQ